MAWLNSLFGASDRPAGAITTVLDLVTGSAELVSNKEEIDRMLDDVRRVTAHLTPDQELSPEQEKILLSVYFKLEEYLTTKEPLRAFTKQELRLRCSKELFQKLTQDTAPPNPISSTNITSLNA